ncbi:TPA: hypothetical protein U1250_000991 [Streptococcus suis]|nr:hypothetical protein [Streptococcus suis]HEL2164668.1 hypothetical protein [Streptococcus suis]HEM5036777.1 hypothetical protein [Streptococcus suis]HEM5112760.1 hypothetical protein [Streptococcus suis]HEM5187601.1 hypothetical protein [Streptococcus suis]
MKIKIRLGDADADRTEVHQIKSTTSDFDFEEYQLHLLKIWLDTNK